MKRKIELIKLVEALPDINDFVNLYLPIDISSKLCKFSLDVNIVLDKFNKNKELLQKEYKVEIKNDKLIHKTKKSNEDYDKEFMKLLKQKVELDFPEISMTFILNEIKKSNSAVKVYVKPQTITTLVNINVLKY